MRWLADASAATVAGALRDIAPELGRYPIRVREVPGRDEPLWQAGSALVGDRFGADTAAPGAVRALGPADQERTVSRWCDWLDTTLGVPGPGVLVHSDLHGDNQVWEHGELRPVIDFETVCAAEPEYDLRALPGTGPGIELLIATTRHYEVLTGNRLSVDRVLAWHVRTALGDALWRSESGIPLPDRRTPGEWIDDLATRLKLAS
jgi:Phosphotransferase enzyme family